MKKRVSFFSVSLVSSTLLSRSFLPPFRTNFKNSHPDALPHPGAVVVEPKHAVVADRAVGAPRGPVVAAGRAPLRRDDGARVRHGDLQVGRSLEGGRRRDVVARLVQMGHSVPPRRRRAGPEGTGPAARSRGRARRSSAGRRRWRRAAQRRSPSARQGCGVPRWRRRPPRGPR